MTSPKGRKEGRKREKNQNKERSMAQFSLKKQGLYFGQNRHKKGMEGFQSTRAFVWVPSFIVIVH